ncbi:MAG TPA: manganese transporter, partial [Planctomycetes bacterium]|nr:manganese transporter [Planctomycetota bacterium]
MKSLLLRSLILWSWLPLLVAGCTDSPSAPSRSTLQILCTTEMIAGPMRTLVGSHAEVSSLMGAGVDPHLYKPSPTDVQRLLDADLVLFHGHHLEGRMGDIL